jgi:tetratricopeptide (TPR) repeat protein
LSLAGFFSGRPAVAQVQGPDPAVSSARPSREQLLSLLNEANAAFQQANAAADNPDSARQLYDKAILLYEKVIDQGGVQNARLYYNVANAYLLRDDVGRAILNYRRAAALDRADINIQKNLTFARSQRIDKVEVGAQKRVLETLFFWHYDFSLRTKFLLACLSFAGLCLALAAAVWLGRGPLVTAGAALAGVLLLCSITSLLIETHRLANTRSGVITAPQVVARQGDGPNYPASFKDPLHAGTEFELIEHRPGWLHIQLSDGTDTWIPDDTAGIV